MSRSCKKEAGLVKLSKARKDRLTEVLGLDSKTVVTEGIREYVRELLMLAVETLVNTEVMERAGKRYGREEECYRWGKQAGSVLLLEQRIPIEKPRLRTKGGGGVEIELETYKALNERNILSEQAGAKLLSGLSTRRFEKTVDQLVRGNGIGRQTISQRGIEDMTKKLEEFRERSLSSHDFLAIFVDGIGLADMIFVTAVGIDSNGKRHVLGFEPGSTENSGVCRALLSNLMERGILSEQGGYLFVVDGGKGLKKAITEVFGKRVEIQRCMVHKWRNVKDKLPKHMHEQMRQKFNAAFNKETHKAALQAFGELGRWLIVERRYVAHKSLMEGMTELLTLHKLGVKGTLRRSLCTTNCIESTFSAARYYTRNVKRWRNEAQMERWLAAGLLEAEIKLRKVPGYTGLKHLKHSLRNSANAK